MYRRVAAPWLAVVGKPPLVVEKPGAVLRLGVQLAAVVLVDVAVIVVVPLVASAVPIAVLQRVAGGIAAVGA